MDPVPQPRLDDEVTAALSGGERRRALTLLMDAYGDAVYRFAHEMTRDATVADEVRQQVFVEAFRDLDDFGHRSSFRTWLFGIARHRCLDATKLRNRWVRRFKNESPDEPVETLDLARELDRPRIARVLEHCLQKLAPAAREAVLLRYQQELSYDEVGQVTGERAGTLQQRVARALPVLRRCVELQLRSTTIPEARVTRAETTEMR